MAAVDSNPPDIDASIAALGGSLLIAARQSLPAAAVDNLFISPLSVHAALAMTAAGTAGPTRTELLALLGCGADPSGALLASSWRELRTQLGAVRGPSVVTANSAWARARLSRSFATLVLEMYGAHTGPLDSASRINGWVGTVTHGKITNLVPSDVVDNPLTQVILVNALYFKGSWRTSFDSYLTRPQPFRCSPTSAWTVHMMSTTSSLPAARREHYIECWLPYASEPGSPPVFGVVVLPHVGSSVTAALGEWTGHVRLPPTKLTTLRLPRFKADASLDVVHLLAALGAKGCTGTDADFAPMFEDSTRAKGVRISNVLHRCVVEVDEQGTEAAAATAVVAGSCGPLGSSGPSPMQVHCDRPFGFAVVVAQAVVLFVGEVHSPEQVIDAAMEPQAKVGATQGGTPAPEAPAQPNTRQ